MAETKKIYRYPAVNPFSEEQSALFFGRADETQRLASLLFSEKLTVLYGKSGYGKSSLLNAGILPRLRAENAEGKRQYVPVTVRFQSAEAGGQSLFDKFRFHWKTAIDKGGIAPAAVAIPGLPDTLWGLFKTIQPADNAVFVLLFDQFEEFFSYPADQQARFKEQLSELLYTSYPAFLRENRRSLLTEAADFLGRDLEVHAVFAIREDRLSDLDQLSDRLPDILRKRMQLGALNEQQAREAIVRPAGFVPSAALSVGVTRSHPDTNPIAFITPPFAYDEAAVQKIIRELAGSEAQRIESFQLQIVCFSIEKKVEKEGLSRITPADLPDFETVYDNYYTGQIEEIRDPALQKTARRLLEFGLLFVDTNTGDAHRRSVDSLELAQTYQATPELLDALEKTYLIRREINSFNRFSYEISHDTLMKPVQKSRKASEMAEAERLHREKISAEKAESDRRRRQALATSLVAGALVLAAAVGIVVALLKSAEAREAIAEAQRQKGEADKSKEIAQAKTDTATVMQQKALLADSIADLKTKEAKTAVEQALLKKQEAQLASLQAVEALLAQAREDVLRLRYDRAFSKMKNAASLGVIKDSVAYELMEIAYFHHHSGHDERAREPFGLAARLLGKPEGAGKMAFEKLDAGRERLLEERYFGSTVDLKGGTFQMQDKYEATVASFKMSKYETTVWQYNLFCVAKGRNITQRIGPDGDTLKTSKYQPAWGWTGDHPVVYVSWYDAVEYANWLSVQLNLKPAYKIYPMKKDSLNKNTEYDDFRWTVELVENANGFRLPTEMEWEYAARGGIQRDTFMYSGSDKVDEVAWYDRNSESHTHPVGGKKANGAGLYDMSGNSYEWCFDWYDGELPEETIRGAKSGKHRFVRGGTWNLYDFYCQVSDRLVRIPVDRYNYTGFRLLRH